MYIPKEENLLDIRGKVLILGAFVVLMLTPAFAQTESAVAGTPALHCKHSIYSTTSSRLLASASTTSNIKCLKAVRHVSQSKLTFYKHHRWVLAPRYKKWWYVPSQARRDLARKGRAEVRLYTTVLSRVEARIDTLTGPSWCAHLSGNRALGCRMAYKQWPSQSEWRALDTLWGYESGWSTHADNPTSDACGIPQAMNNCAYGYLAVVQIGWGINYILGRKDYGSPSRALAHWYSVGWY